MEKSALDWIVLVLVIVGAINWGLASFSTWNLVEMIFRIPWLIKLVYGLVGLSGLYMIWYINQ